MGQSYITSTIIPIPIVIIFAFFVDNIIIYD